MATVSPPLTSPGHPATWADLWVGLALRGLLIVAALFLGWELLERAAFGSLPLETLHRLHIVRGVGSSFILATWAFLGVRRSRLEHEAAQARLLAELEARVEQRTREIRQAEAVAREHERLAGLGVLAAGIAHDLGNPLGSLSSELEMLEVEQDPERIRESLAVLRRHVDRMARALRDIVGFARRRGDERCEVRVEEAIADAVRLVAHDSRRARVEVETAEGLPPARMVEDQLVMVLVNLLLNAVDASPRGAAVRVGAHRAGDRVVLTVADRGTGMSPEVLARATEPFYTTKAGRGGTGLGLSGSRRVVAAAGGRLAIDSREGVGTTISLELPVFAKEAA